MDGLFTASVFTSTAMARLRPIPSFWWKSVPVGKVDVLGTEIEGAFDSENFAVSGTLTSLEAEVVASSDAALFGLACMRTNEEDVRYGQCTCEALLGGISLSAGERPVAGDGEACWTDLGKYGGDKIGDERRVDDDRDGSAVQICVTSEWRPMKLPTSEGAIGRR